MAGLLFGLNLGLVPLVSVSVNGFAESLGLFQRGEGSDDAACAGLDDVKQGHAVITTLCPCGISIRAM